MPAELVPAELVPVDVDAASHPSASRASASREEVELDVEVTASIGGNAFPQAKYSGGQVVAEEGLEPPTQGL